MVGVILSFGVGLGLMGLVGSTAMAFIIMLVMGAGNGVLSISLITFLQQKTPHDMLGRVMSLVMLAGVGLQPVSQAITGALIKFSLDGVFFGTGMLMVLIALWLALQPTTRTIHEALADLAPGPAADD